MKGLFKRLTFSAVFIAIALLAIFAAPLWVFIAVVEGFILTALNEYLHLAAIKGVTVHRVSTLLFCTLLPVAVLFSLEGAVILACCLVLSLFHFREGRQKGVVLSLAAALFGMVYVGWFFSYLVKIRTLEHGAFWVFYTLLLVKSGDAAAYFYGSKYGRTKLIEPISPNKSVEGAWAGLAATLLLSLIAKTYMRFVPWRHLFVLGVCVGVLSQIADLVESALKRDGGIKDSGQVPGLGGILDIMDSLLLTVPFVYYYITFFLRS